MRIVVSEFMDEAAVATLAAHHPTEYDAGLVDRREELKAKLVDADGLLVRHRTQVNVELLAAAPRLRVVGRLGVGLDNIAVAACNARGIAVIPATGAEKSKDFAASHGRPPALAAACRSRRVMSRPTAWPKILPPGPSATTSSIS